MIVKIYGPEPRDEVLLAELMKHVPEDAEQVYIRCPVRNPMNIRVCQRPGVLEYVASVDNRVFIYVTSDIKGVTTVKIMT